MAARALSASGTLDTDFILVGPEGLTETEGFELLPVGRWQPGLGPAEAGRLSVLAIQRAVQLASADDVDAIVTAPINKAAIAAAGHSWPGHTEMLRDLTGTPLTALCLAADDTPHGSPLRVVLVTGHLALARVPEAYTSQRLLSIARLANADLSRWWGIAQPRLAVCAFNPHASDEGLFGDEEARICAPAVEQLRAEGIAAAGPYPADTVFVRAMRGEFDAVLAPYHDVGMVAIKTAAFGKAVNVTLGLPFPRTSPDHGTAFDIAGTGQADPGSMQAALAAAAAFARRALTLDPGSRRLANG
ncbi:MAG TPA: 4-hydroxythreonine-4-phosphate dehydrogenase PdxA [Gemmatimonadota bacterium]|nr:4-hydroxythreonine-4-phosphate dehydrogenase PdxA [Gemmatimonadota bacterium]